MVVQESRDGVSNVVGGLGGKTGGRIGSCFSAPMPFKWGVVEHNLAA